MHEKENLLSVGGKDESTAASVVFIHFNGCE